MGVGSFLSSSPPSEAASLSSQDFPHESINSSGHEEDSVINGPKVLNSRKFPDVGHGRLSSVDDEAAERQKFKVYSEVLRSYQQLEEAKNKILAYTTGSWAEKASGIDLREYDVQSATSLLLIGPQSSGKSSLINKIFKALEKNFREVDFDIFVVNGLSVLESMDSDDEKNKLYSDMIATNFNNPLLSFKDDKPAVVVTHGDLLSRSRVHVHLGELLGIPPTRQYFDIPENDDLASTLATYDMLIYSLERADKSLPTNDLFVEKVYAVGILLLLAVAVAIVFVFPGFRTHNPPASTIRCMFEGSLGV